MEKALTIEEARATHQNLSDKVISFESACKQKDAELERQRGLVHELEQQVQHLKEQQANISTLKVRCKFENGSIK